MKKNIQSIKSARCGVARVAKKFFLCATILILCASVFADMPIMPNQLSPSVQKFISETFPGRTVTLAKKDWDDLEVYLDDGTEITFGLTGRWHDIKSYAGVPTSVLPVAAGNQIATNFSDAKIVEVERKMTGYEVQLSNFMKLYFSANGNFVGQKFDD